MKLGMENHNFKPSTHVAEVGRSLNSKTDWSTV